MALTAAEVVATRLHCGYPARGAVGAGGAADLVAPALAGLSAEEEARLRSDFLSRLDPLSAALPDASGTLDTAKAAVWERNAAELAERSSLYRTVRLELCYYLGIPAGPAVWGTVIVAPSDPGGTGAGGGDSSLLFPPAILVV